MLRSPSDRLVKLLVHGSLALAWAVLLSGYDTWLCAQRTSFASRLQVLAIFASFAVGVILLSVLPLALMRGALRDWASGRALYRFLVGALDGALVAYLVCMRERYATVTPEQKWIVAALLIPGAGLAFVAAPRWPRFTSLASAVIMLSALGLSARLPFRELPWVHFALALIAAAGFVGLATPLAQRLSPVGQQVSTALALGLLLLSPYTFRNSMPTRGLLHDMSTHARAHSVPAQQVYRVPRQGAGRVGKRRCGKGPKDGCAGAVADEATALSGGAEGADVLLLSIDALRWDRHDALPHLKRELGAHVRFSRALSPGVRTLHSFGALLRGRPLRQVTFDARVAHGGVPDTAESTVGSVFAEQGYRAVSAPTHTFLREPAGITSGFELLPVAQADAESRMHRETRRPFQHAASALIQAAKDTPGPLLAWVHAMETHDPYVSDKQVDSTSDGQLRAARDLDKRLAQLLRDFRHARAGRSLVIAVFGDHGEEFGEHGGRFHSSTVYAELSRVTWLLAAPGLVQQVIDAPVSTAALPSTLFQLVGLKRPCSFTVPSVLACAERKEVCPSLAVTELVPFGSNRKVLVGYTDGRHRLLYDREHEILHLFDTERDPYEQRDLVFSEPHTLNHMRQAALRWDKHYCVAKE